MTRDILLSAELTHDPAAQDDADGALDAIDAGATVSAPAPHEYLYTDAVYMHTVGDCIEEIAGGSK